MSEEFEEEYEEETEEVEEAPKAKERKMNGFHKCIKAYLDGYSSTDSYFKAHYDKPNKNIFECCEYIMVQAKKQLDSGNCVGMTDDEVFHLAREYYELDKIKDSDKAKASEVIGTASTGMVNDPSENPMAKHKAVQREIKKKEDARVEAQAKVNKDGNKGEQLDLFASMFGDE